MTGAVDISSVIPKLLAVNSESSSRLPYTSSFHAPFGLANNRPNCA
ncbi:MAG: hypothetical protein M3450_01665 [Actinomycetota bacterium]|nr:hypothetical protein [Actinomycetota bacterium]